MKSTMLLPRLSFCLLLPLVACTRLFHLGRPRGGFVGAPNIDYPEDGLPPAKWFTQRLNHFNDADPRTWSQRYFVNDTYARKDGPVFLMIGGEGPANPIWMVTGTWMDFAAEMGALCFMVEHRYYGDSHPTEDMGVDNLQYLSSELALADLGHFITNMTTIHSLTGRKWVTFGGSYPGSLSAWMRLKYPHLVYAAVATSAPLQAKLNFKEYLDVVEDSLLTSEVGGSQCVVAVQAATTQMDKAWKNLTQWRNVEPQFKLCSPLDFSHTFDKMNLRESLAGNFMNVVQYNKDNRAFEGAIGTNITLDTLCDIMLDEKIGTEILRYARVNVLLLETYNQTCLDYSYKKMIAELRDTSWKSGAAEGGRQWLYQTCTEFGFYQTSDSTQQPFGDLFPLGFSLQQCTDIFGQKFNEDNLNVGISRTNTNYGGYNLTAERVVLPNGSIDPWHYLGITATTNKLRPAVYINGTAHCANMYPARADDPPELVQARTLIKGYLTTWLN